MATERDSSTRSSFDGRIPDTSAPLASPLHYLGHRLRTLRRTKGLSLRELASLAQIDSDHIRCIEQAEPVHESAAAVAACDRALGAGGELIDLHGMIASTRRDTAEQPRGNDNPHPHDRAHDQVPVPRQLPAAIRDFTGRATDLLALDALLPTNTTRTAIGRPGTVVISAIDGAAGIGKTTLAVYWGHRMRHRFPDGTLYANLRGYGPGQAATAGEVLDAFLRALGIPAARIPTTADERAALYRSLLDDRRMLVVLDNANASEQVRPLLPAGSGCLALVTSRSSMTGLVVSQGAARISLDLLSFDEAVVLLRGIVGDIRADAEPQALAEIVHACARLPLALRIAGARAASRPRLRLADLRAELLDQHTRLDTLSSTADEETAVRTVFAWSYQALSDEQALTFRRLGLHPGVQIDVYAAATLADTSPDEARINLEALADVHLAESAAPDRYLTHDLLRAYAAEQTEHHDTETERQQATLRLLGYYLHAADSVDRMALPRRWRTAPDAAPCPSHTPPISTIDQAVTWFDEEQPNLVAAVRHAASSGLHAPAWQMAGAATGLFATAAHHDAWDTLLNIGLVSAQTIGDQYAELYLLAVSSEQMARARRFEEAEHHARRAVNLSRDLHDATAEAHTVSNLALVHARAHQSRRAAECAQQAVDLFKRLSDTWGAAIATNFLGEAHQGMGKFDDASACHNEALDAFRASRDRVRESWALRLLGDAHRAQGRFDQAIDAHRLALELARKNRDRIHEVEALHGLGDDMHLSGDPDAACEHWTQALALYEQLGDPRADDIRSLLRR
jgi:tetratricopeptide (TPR) repeat protein/transcriptional regulator with XRE-family HTH domain